MISEQVELYRTITGEHRVPPAGTGAAAPEETGEPPTGGQVLPLRPRRQRPPQP